MASVRIVERRTGKIVEAELIPDVTQQQTEEAEELWKPYRISRRAAEEVSGESTDWDWGNKRQEAEEGIHRISGILCDGRMQGMMMLRTKSVHSRRSNSENARVLYVEYLEAAPWNQERYVDQNALYGAVGVVLLKHAIHESESAGCKGEIGLLSLKEAEDYYRPWFLDVGIDRVEGLRYFEMTATLAPKLSRRETIPMKFREMSDEVLLQFASGPSFGNASAGKRHLAKTQVKREATRVPPGRRHLVAAVRERKFSKVSSHVKEIAE